MRHANEQEELAERLLKQSTGAPEPKCVVFRSEVTEGDVAGVSSSSIYHHQVAEMQDWGTQGTVCPFDLSDDDSSPSVKAHDREEGVELCAQGELSPRVLPQFSKREVLLLPWGDGESSYRG